MTKSEYIKWRQEQRVAGTLPSSSVRIEISENKLSAHEEGRVLSVLKYQKSGMYRTHDLDLGRLLTMVEYTGRFVKVQRRKVDELDNVTVWRI